MQTSPLSTANRVGLGLAVVLSLMDLAALLVPTPPGEVGPPYVVLVFAAVLGVVTLAAVVPAASGVTVVKHGNRSVSSKSGSADVLEVLPPGAELVVTADHGNAEFLRIQCRTSLAAKWLMA